MFGWLRPRQQERLYVIETPYSKLFNLDAEALERHRQRALIYPPTYPETIRPMTDEERRKYASD